MICNRCGIHNTEDSNVCVNCGNNLVVNDSMNQNMGMNQQPNMNQNMGMNQQPNMNQNMGLNQQSNMNQNMGMNQQPNINQNMGVNQQPNMNQNMGVNQQTNMNQNMGMNQQPNMNQNMGMNQQNYMNGNYQQYPQRSKVDFKTQLLMLIGSLIKPFTIVKDISNKSCEAGNSLFLAITTVIFALLTTFIFKIHSLVYYRGKWIWENLEDFEFFEIFLEKTLIYSGLILGLALAYFVIGAIMKKEISFWKMLTISSIGIFIIFVGTLLVTPIMANMSFKFAGFVSTIFFTGGLLYIYETYNNELKIEGNAKYYVNMFILGIFTITFQYYLGSYTLLTSLGGIVDDFDDAWGDIFGLIIK